MYFYPVFVTIENSHHLSFHLFFVDRYDCYSSVETPILCLQTENFLISRQTHSRGPLGTYR